MEGVSLAVVKNPHIFLLNEFPVLLRDSRYLALSRLCSLLHLLTVPLQLLPLQQMGTAHPSALCGCVVPCLPAIYLACYLLQCYMYLGLVVVIDFFQLLYLLASHLQLRHRICRQSYHRNDAAAH